MKQKRISFLERLVYLLQKYPALISKKLEIKYLGKGLQYDNYTTPATLQSYPKEIVFLHHYINFDRACHILDIGANLGQFSLTLGSLFQKANLYSFEANPHIFKLLESNSRGMKNIRPFNIAVGPYGQMPFYFVPGASAKGSFIKSNAIINLKNRTYTVIEVAQTAISKNFCRDHDLPSSYDLIKIDVEGYEYEVLDGIKEVQTKYLYVEFSQSRESNYHVSELMKKIERYFGEFRILFCDQIDLNPKRTLGNLLVRFGRR